MNNFTLIVPTHNRHNYLKRSIEYFKNLNAIVIYCDSSVDKYEGSLHDNTKYFHLPGKCFAEKISFVLEIINTDFVAMCADDDFIIIESLHKGFEFLSKNINYKTVVGDYIGFNENFDGKFYPIYKKLPNDINLGYKKNAEVFFDNYFQLLWSMFDKKILVKSFKVIKEAKFHNDNFIELVIGAFACFEGGIKFLNDLWGIREIGTNQHWGSRHLPIISKKIANENGDFIKFRNLVDQNTSIGYSDSIINNYIFGQSKNYGFFRSRISKIIPGVIKNVIKNNRYLKKNKPDIYLDNYAKEYISIISLLSTND